MQILARWTLPIILALAAPAQAAAPPQADCPGGQALAPFKSRPITAAQDVLFFRTDRIKLDIDGSPKAYGVKDQGTENICNGLGPLRPPICKGKVSAANGCYAACQAAFRAWDGNPATLGQYMCSIGLGGGSCGTPKVKLQSTPREAWFVSETSVHPAKPADVAMTTGAWLQSQGGQLDSEQIPYFVIPGGFRAMAYDATPGDLGVVVREDGSAVPFIVGDTGGNLDEGSARLIARLKGLEALPTQKKTNAFGQQVDRLSGEGAGAFRIAIFRHTAPLPVGHRSSDPSLLTVTAADLPEWIRAKAQAKLDAIGGTATVIACAK